MFRFGFLVVLFLILTTYSAKGAALEITDFKAGLICEYTADLDDLEVPISWVCFETEIIYLTGQGDCVYDGQDKKCTWYGFEFDYTNAKKDEQLACISWSTLPSNEGNFEGVRAKQETYGEWEISLEPGDGHYFHPQYTVSRFSKDVQELDNDQTVCSIDGEEKFRFGFTKIFPALTRDRLEKALRRIMD